ncbi:MAG: helix-turn-helix domain-containing protein [Anaerolineae bacterium]|nr:helix-turn-helix domain-containing protein [Anaerolineae bacterium]
MQSTRQEILEILKVERTATVEDLASRLELTPMTIRHHLNVLQAQNMVAATKVRRSQKVGRPRLIYTLTEAADQLFPQSYGELARRIVTELKETVGKEETRALFRRIASRLAKQAPPPTLGQSFEDRLNQVGRFLDSQGLITHWKKTDQGYVFVNVNCPYRRVAQEHAETCELDIALITELLGVVPKQLSSLRQEGFACSYLLEAPEKE